MKRVNVLFGKVRGLYTSFLTPMFINRRLLKDVGITFRIFHEENDALHDADCVIVGSTLYREWMLKERWGAKAQEKTVELFENLKKDVDKVFWFDCSESTASNNFKFLPYVDKFLKPYLLKDKTLYQRQYYRNRIYTDYYHKHFGVKDREESPSRELPKDSDLSKIHLAWNHSLGDFGTWAPYWRKLRTYLPLPMFYCGRFVEPNSSRTIDVHMRFETEYNRETVAFQRQLIKQKANQLGMPTDKIQRRRYLKELRNSKVAVSPWAWGEANCPRDYEIILNGCMLIKPDMSHMVVWPDLYVAGETYMPFKWDCSDLESVWDRALQGQKWIGIARQAQTVYRKYLFEREGREEFCTRLLSLVA